MGTDPAVVERARSGDRRAFAVLHARYARMVHGILLTRLAAADAEDATQDVFLLAWQRLGDLSDPAAFGGGLAHVARNHAIDVGRKARRRRLVDSLLAAWDGSCAWMGLGAVSGAFANQDAGRILDTIRGLPEAYRETLAMRLVEGLSGPEISELTGLTPGSVRVNLHRGMELLSAQLGEAA